MCENALAFYVFFSQNTHNLFLLQAKKKLAHRFTLSRTWIVIRVALIFARHQMELDKQLRVKFSCTYCVSIKSFQSNGSTSEKSCDAVTLMRNFETFYKLVRYS